MYYGPIKFVPRKYQTLWNSYKNERISNETPFSSDLFSMYKTVNTKKTEKLPFNLNQIKNKLVLLSVSRGSNKNDELAITYASLKINI